MYFETVDWATSKPSFRSSPWMCGAPQSGFSKLILRIRSRSSLSICGRPPRGRDFHRQNALKPFRCHYFGMLLSISCMIGRLKLSDCLHAALKFLALSSNLFTSITDLRFPP